MIERLESSVSRAIEGWTGRLFRARLQPVQIAKRLIRAMESGRRIALARTFAPNSYLVSLSSLDHEAVAGFRGSLERDLAESVLGAARDRGYTLVAFPVVEVALDPTMRRGDIRVACALVDASGAALADADLNAAASHTVVLDRELLIQEHVAPAAFLDLVGDGEAAAPSVALGAGGCVIGRDRRCDVVLDDARISRRHAEIRLRLGRYALADLGSVNGTHVNGTRVTEVALTAGDRIAIGPITLVFRAGVP